MSHKYDPHLDDNYRVVGDRVISERTYQSEQLAGGAVLLIALLVGFLNRAFPLPKLAKIAAGIAVGIAFLAGVGPGSSQSILNLLLSGDESDRWAVLLLLAAAGVVGVIGYFLATGCIVATAMYFAYRAHGFIAAVFTLTICYSIVPVYRRVIGEWSSPDGTRRPRFSKGFKVSLACILCVPLVALGGLGLLVGNGSAEMDCVLMMLTGGIPLILVGMWALRKQTDAATLEASSSPADAQLPEEFVIDNE